MTSTFPPPGYVPAPSAVPGIELYRPRPEEEEERQPDVVDFRCPQCQATTAYSVADGGLRCSHCGYYEPPAKPVVGKGAEEFEFTVEAVEAAAVDATLQAHGWGEARKSIKCQQCSAETSVPAGELTHTCPFCGSNRVIQHEAAQDMLRPRFLIPFQFEAKECRPIAGEWLGSSWMTPAALAQIARVANFSAVYMPYWTFDAVTEADWKAEVGHEETQRYYDDGEWKTRKVTVWRWESGHARELFDDLLVPGTARTSNVLLGRAQNFDTRALVAYDPKFLAGLMAQAYDVPLEDAWAQGRQKMRVATKAACRSQASTSKIRNFSMSMDFSDESWRYVLLPIYISAYQYEGETFQVLINGQTGKVAGQRPVDWPKVWLAIAAMVAPGLLIGLFALVALLIPPLGIFLGIVAIFALAVGGFFAFNTFDKARRMGDV